MQRSENMEEYKICYECGSELYPKIVTRTFNGKNKSVTIDGIKAYVCDKCGDEVYSSEDAKRIFRVFEEEGIVNAKKET